MATIMKIFLLIIKIFLLALVVFPAILLFITLLLTAMIVIAILAVTKNEKNELKNTSKRLDFEFERRDPKTRYYD